eukprot:CAMPEP_0172932832 /NCGR_PEP_ID=MMETSP1075-20121228/220199_1 /TAXON_ID=2916 /ORGANISM="Ceratium fusus, Strain PA161109" /LENGTH=138 /DNA_ID=CAMNT_0013794165 /DNA_START=369 /DNA_END=787 /DNA_ORIENTATION=+
MASLQYVAGSFTSLHCKPTAGRGKKQQQQQQKQMKENVAWFDLINRNEFANRLGTATAHGAEQVLRRVGVGTNPSDVAFTVKRMPARQQHDPFQLLWLAFLGLLKANAARSISAKHSLNTEGLFVKTSQAKHPLPSLH